MTNPWSAPDPPSERHAPPPPPEEAGGWTISRTHEMLDMVRAAAEDDPRSDQVHLGPSEIGSPCKRYIGFRVLDAPKRKVPLQWRTRVGTAVHTWLKEKVEMLAEKGTLATELGVWVEGEGNEQVAGSLDVLQIRRSRDGKVEIVDWKIPGKTTMGKAAKGRIDGKYGVQLDVYGLGVERTLGLTPTDVTIIYIPASGEFEEARAATRPWDRDRALESMTRFHKVRDTAKRRGLLYVAQNAPTGDDFCSSCAYLGVVVPGATPDADPVTLCRGHAIEKKEAG